MKGYKMKYIEYEDKIRKLANGLLRKESKVKAFFSQAYSKFNVSDRRKILELFETAKISKSIARWYNFIERNDDIKQIIMNDAEENMNILMSEENIAQTTDLLKFTEVFLNISNLTIDDPKMQQILSRLTSITDSNHQILHSEEVKKILEYYIKEMAWKSSDKEYMQTLKDDSGYKVFEKLICKYIESIDLNDDLYNDCLLMLLSETQNIIDSSKLSEVISKKFSSDIHLEDYIGTNESKEKIWNAIVIYRLKNSILPKDICAYLVKNKELARVANIDYTKQYLKDSGIENAAVFYDERLITPGIANYMRLSLNNKQLDESSFHEATHVIQQADILERKDFSGNRYAMLKDFILQRKVGWNVYNQNHNNWIFEIDADTQGGIQYLQYLKDIGSEEYSSDRIRFLLEAQKRRLRTSKQILIDDKYVSKKELFEKDLIDDPELITRHPVLAIEYNLDGSRKNPFEILQSLEERLASSGNDLEIQDIANCIIDDMDKLSEEDVNALKKYSTETPLIIDIKEKIIEHSAKISREKLPLELVIESEGANDISYIEQTSEELYRQEQELQEEQSVEKRGN